MMEGWEILLKEIYDLQVVIAKISLEKFNPLSNNSRGSNLLWQNLKIADSLLEHTRYLLQFVSHGLNLKTFSGWTLVTRSADNFYDGRF